MYGVHVLQLLNPAAHLYTCQITAALLCSVVWVSLEAVCMFYTLCDVPAAAAAAAGAMSCRLFGTKLAEMPYVATRKDARRAGNCRRLFKVRVTAAAV
jgi:hypothetical protein